MRPISWTLISYHFLSAPTSDAFCPTLTLSQWPHLLLHGACWGKQKTMSLDSYCPAYPLTSTSALSAVPEESLLCQSLHPCTGSHPTGHCFSNSPFLLLHCLFFGLLFQWLPPAYIHALFLSISETISFSLVLLPVAISFLLSPLC